MPSGEKTRISFSLFPSDNFTAVSWFKNGLQVTSEKAEINYDSLNEQAATIIGGQNGFTGSIYKLTVFYRDDNGNFTIDPDIFKSELLNTYKEKLIFADGFDGR